jgi:hypothetical protein
MITGRIPEILDNHTLKDKLVEFSAPTTLKYRSPGEADTELRGSHGGCFGRTKERFAQEVISHKYPPLLLLQFRNEPEF